LAGEEEISLKVQAGALPKVPQPCVSLSPSETVCQVQAEGQLRVIVEASITTGAEITLSVKPIPAPKPVIITEPVVSGKGSVKIDFPVVPKEEDITQNEKDIIKLNFFAESQGTSVSLQIYILVIPKDQVVRLKSVNASDPAATKVTYTTTEKLDMVTFTFAGQTQTKKDVAAGDFDFTFDQTHLPKGTSTLLLQASQGEKTLPPVILFANRSEYRASTDVTRVKPSVLCPGIGFVALYTRFALEVFERVNYSVLSSGKLIHTESSYISISGLMAGGESYTWEDVNRRVISLSDHYYEEGGVKLGENPMALEEGPGIFSKNFLAALKIASDLWLDPSKNLKGVFTVYITIKRPQGTCSLSPSTTEVSIP